MGSTQNIVALAIATLLVSACSVNADCPDVDYRCRIPISNVEVKQKSDGKGWEVGGTASAEVGVESGKPKAGAGVEVNGKYYETETTTSTNYAEYIVIGSITVGSCYDWAAVQCRVEKCGRGTGQERCNKQLDGCRPKPVIKSSDTYTVKSGDTCDQIATANSISLPELESLNPGKCGVNLAIGTKLTLGEKTSYGEAVDRCEAHQP